METDGLVKAMEMFWTKDDSGEEDHLSLVELKGIPVQQKHKEKRNSPSKRKKQPEMEKERKCDKNKQLQQKSEHKKTLPLKSSRSPGKENKAENGKSAKIQQSALKASLKDLCAADKMRIAQLVQELAKSGEECDRVKGSWLEERNRYEGHMRELIEQQDEILEQRKSIQQQLMDCQKLVEKYQKYLLKQQKSKEKKVTLNTEVTQELDTQQYKKLLGSKARGGQQQRTEAASAGESATCRTSAQQESAAYKGEQEQVKSQSGGRAHPSSGSPSPRPFTTMIDKLLAQGKDNNLAAPDNNIVAAQNVAASTKRAVAGETTSDILSNGGWNALEPSCSPPSAGLLKERLFRVGPLEAPVMSSTHCSDLTNGLSDKVRVKAEEFHPLQVDQRSASTSSSQHSADTDMVHGGCLFKGGYDNRLPLDVGAAIKRASMEDTDFVKYYRKLSPEERKRQLIAQKEALVQEQQRLKAILIEQEALLRAKQEQLHSQQQLQKHRLQFFEQMGFFPNLGLNGHSLNYEAAHHQGQEEQAAQQQGGPMEAQGLQSPQHLPGGQHVQQPQHVHGQYGQQPYLPYQAASYMASGSQHPVSSEAMHGAAYHSSYPTSSSVAYMPYAPENLHGQYPGQQYMHASQGPPGHVRPWTMGGMNGGYPHQDSCAGGGYNMDYMGQHPLPPCTPSAGPMEVHHHQEGPQLPHHPHPVHDNASSSSFLHRHGVHISPPNREHRKGLELPEMRSAATSPLRPVCQDRQSSQPALHYSDEAEQPHYTVLESAQQANRQHNEFHLMNGDGGCGHEKQGNHLAEMEMGQTQSPSNFPPRTPASAQPTQGEHYLLDLVEEVESIHNSNHDYMGSPQSPGSVHSNSVHSNNMAAAYSSGYSEKELSDYDEENRVLREVFFVK